MTGIFAKSKKDGYLVGISLAHTALLAAAACLDLSESTTATTAFICLHAFLICVNYQCIAHNYLHNPFFKSKNLNRAFAIVNSPLLVFPSSLYKEHHLNHHRYTNDRQDQHGKTKDLSSIFRFGKKGQPESFLMYSLLNPWRTDIGQYYEMDEE